MGPALQHPSRFLGRLAPLVTDRGDALDRAFTIVICTCCEAPRGLQIQEQLREVIRRSRHGILVTAPCFLGKFTCAARNDGPGAMVVLQPCSVGRSPFGPPLWVGPIAGPADVVAMRIWLESGDWHIGRLPQRMQSPLNWLAAASRRN